MNPNYFSTQEVKEENEAKVPNSERKPAILRLKNLTNQPEQS